MKSPKVTLINYTPNAMKTMIWARKVMHDNVPDDLKKIKLNKKYINEVLRKDGMPTFLEYINLVFKLENVSRALQQQLTRHRIGFSYSIQSLRCVKLPRFATDYNYYNPFPSKYTNKHKHFHNLMLGIQHMYKEALSLGMNTQDARGLLPLNIFSTITFSCSLRALIGMVNKRLCLKTQDEFREVAGLVVNEVTSKLGSDFSKWFKKPCEYGKCMMEAENLEQAKAKKWMGQQNTDHCCPLFIKKFYNKS
jgi:flavin-dependent thymidylate synthase